MKVLCVILILAWSVSLRAVPFSECPTQAFLMQDKPARLYGVNLYSGYFQELAPSLGTDNGVNGIGFNQFDNYLYGWSYEFGTVVKVSSDYSIEPITLSGAPSTNFYVGDVALTSNDYYFYRPGASFGLYRVALDSSASNFAEVERIIDGSALNIAIFDMAFHPFQEFAYSVDRNGRLIKIDATTGEHEVLGNTGQTGTFGAVYFDVNANLYFSRNSDGHIFRVNIDQGQVTAEFYTYGPSSSSNDGARCAMAEIYDPDVPPTVDLGDAPESYDRTPATGSINYAKHEIGTLFLGTDVSAEYEPRAEDADDGVQFVTTLEIGLDALLTLQASEDGFVTAWFDWDQSASFEEDERVLIGERVSTGNNAFVYNVPFGIDPGDIWVRVRLAKLPDIGPIGGAGEGEVSDFQVEVLDSGVTRSDSGWASAAFEDRWPAVGDYDFNDVVVRYKVSNYFKEGMLQRLTLEGYLHAVGADYHNGFAIRLPGIAHDSFNTDLTRFEIDGKTVSSSPLENRDGLSSSATTDAVVIPFADTKTTYQASGVCKYFRTKSGCENVSKPYFFISLSLDTEVSLLQTPTGHLDPFIFAVAGFRHGEYVSEGSERQWEVHLKNRLPTMTGTEAFYQLAEDGSTADFTFQTDKGMPWAILVNETWQHPLEGKPINLAYPDFRTFAEQGGNPLLLWFNNKRSNYVISE